MGVQQVSLTWEVYTRSISDEISFSYFYEWKEYKGHEFES